MESEMKGKSMQMDKTKKTAEILKLISHKIEFTKHKKKPRSHYILTKGSIHQGDVTTVNI